MSVLDAILIGLVLALAGWALFHPGAGGERRACGGCGSSGDEREPELVTLGRGEDEPGR